MSLPRRLRHFILAFWAFDAILVAALAVAHETPSTRVSYAVRASRNPRTHAAPAARAHHDRRHSVPRNANPRDIYAADRANALSARVRHFPPRVYVPNSLDSTVDEIDPRTYRVVRHFRTGTLPQHVTPSYDLKTLWVDNDLGNSLTPVNPRTGRPGRPVPVADPYNLYFTLDGTYAIVVAEQLQRLDFRDPHTMRLRHSLRVACRGVDHLDFSRSGRLALASCEFSGKLLVLDVPRRRVARYIILPGRTLPQDVKLSPDGRTFFVADAVADGVWLIDARTMRRRRFVATGRGAHALYVSRDSRTLYVSNRGEGSISLIALRTGRTAGKWRLPGGGSPDMGGVSADGRVLWLAGRYDSEVYAISTRTGRLLRRIPVGQSPHGLAVYPQPGRYSLGHNGVFR